MSNGGMKMKVVIGKKIYDSKKVPIMVVLGKLERLNIASMPKDRDRMCVCHISISEEKMKEWIKWSLDKIPKEE